jgi:hypothetical protein
MKLIHALLPVCALLLPSALRAESVFEGTVAMSISGTEVSKSGLQNMTYSMKPGYLRMDMATGHGMGGMIMDFNAKQMLILMPQQKMYMVQSMPDSQAGRAMAGQPDAHPGAAKPSIVNTGEKEDILGYTCTKLVITSEHSTAQIWVTDQLGAFGGMFSGGGMGRRPQPPPEWADALKGVGFFPMRVISTNKDGKVFKLEVTAVTKQSLADSLFTPPDGWRKLDLAGMMGGLGGFPGARPPADGSN